MAETSSWVEMDQATRQVISKDPSRSKEFEGEKANSLPVIEKESGKGAALFDPIKFQPVVGTGIYEAEFGVKNGDVIFHFWPHGYHAADAAGRATPSFKNGFKDALKSVAEKEFGKNRIELKDDRDVGALFLRAIGWAESQFHRQLSVKVCETLYKSLGGEG